MNLSIQAKKHGITDSDFLKCIVLDGMMTVSMGKCIIDMIETDNKFGESDEVYDPDNCLYNGEPCSMGEYVEKRWGEKYVRFIESLF